MAKFKRAFSFYIYTTRAPPQTSQLETIAGLISWMYNCLNDLVSAPQLLFATIFNKLFLLLTSPQADVISDFYNSFSFRIILRILGASYLNLSLHKTSWFDSLKYAFENPLLILTFDVVFTFMHTIGSPSGWRHVTKVKLISNA